MVRVQRSGLTKLEVSFRWKTSVEEGETPVVEENTKREAERSLP